MSAAWIGLIAALAIFAGSDCGDELGGGLDGLFACSGDCLLTQYNECTCGLSDPCGWIGDGFCDVTYCAQAVSTYFDDNADCGDSAACEGACGRGTFDDCTCGVTDPCNWINDGYCDEPSCELVTTSTIFDDSADCEGSGGTCDGDCASQRYSECTCGTFDPCGWAQNSRCDQSGCDGVTSSPFDDSSDCSGTQPTGDLTFGVTAVRDDLDNQDLSIMASGLQNLGYASVVRDTNVTTSALTGYLAQDLTLLYHTGHGFDGQVMTADGAISNSGVTLNVQHTIFATCLTLVEPWASAFGSSAESVLGYTKVSYDIIDDDIANRFLTALGQGSRPIVAWYQANSPLSDVSDRWAGYVREGGGIVEYSARSGRNPSAAEGEIPSSLSFVPLGRAGDLLVSSDLLSDSRVFDQPVAEVAVDREARHESATLPGGWDLLGPTRMSREEAQRLAEQFVRSHLGGLPADAVPEPMIEVVRQGVEQPEVTVGYTVVWSRQIEGRPIRSNRVADHIQVLVGARGVVAWSRYWPELEVVPASIDLGAQLLPINRAVELAADAISQAAKGPVQLMGARPVYGTLGPGQRQPTLVPAYELEAADGSRLVVDALTGRLLL